jgi:hypothetical protein
MRDATWDSEFAKRIPAFKSQMEAEQRALGVLIAPQRPTDPAERVAYEMRLVEIRAELRKLDSISRAVVLGTTTDPLTIDACESAPMTVEGKRLVPFVDPKRVEDARRARARAADPAKAEVIEGLEYLIASYGTDLQSVINVIEQNSPSLRAATAVVVDPSGKRERVDLPKGSE